MGLNYKTKNMSSAEKRAKVSASIWCTDNNSLPVLLARMAILAYIAPEEVTGMENK